jgi:Family of unknown function (DUF6152)
MRRTIAITTVLGAAWLFAGLAQAHHAFSTEFDAKRPISLHGKVTKVELINPHSWIYLDVADDKGVVSNWAIEGGSPNALVRRGVTKKSVPVGSEIVIEGYQARDGSHRAVARTLKFADGRPLFFENQQVSESTPQP